MLEKRTLWIALIATLVLLTAFFALVLRPSANIGSKDVKESPSNEIQEINKPAIIEAVDSGSQEEEDVEPLEIEDDPMKHELSDLLTDIKAGKSSVLNLVFSDTDLNQAIKDLLALDGESEPWVNFAIGQIVDTCGELHKRSEPELIEMFSNIGGRGLPAQQQNAISQLMPIVVNASKRCRSVDKDLLASLGDDARSWFRTGAESGDASSYVVSGFTLLNEELKAQSEAYQAASDEERWKVGKELREQARKEFRANMQSKIQNGALTPELLINMSEHLNLFYDKDNDKFKQREAWILLACEMGYENNCSSQSTAVQLMCMFQDSCHSGTDFRQGVLWSQGQYKLDQYQETANELRRVIENKEWDKLGF